MRTVASTSPVAGLTVVKCVSGARGRERVAARVRGERRVVFCFKVLPPGIGAPRGYLMLNLCHHADQMKRRSIAEHFLEPRPRPSAALAPRLLGAALLAVLYSAPSWAEALPASTDPPACRSVRLSDVGWTDVTSTTAIFSALLQRLGYVPKV